MLELLKLITEADVVEFQMLDDILPQTKRKARMEAEAQRNMEINLVGVALNSSTRPLGVKGQCEEAVLVHYALRVKGQCNEQRWTPLDLTSRRDLSIANS